MEEDLLGELRILRDKSGLEPLDDLPRLSAFESVQRPPLPVAAGSRMAIVHLLDAACRHLELSDVNAAEYARILLDIPEWPVDPGAGSLRPNTKTNRQRLLKIAGHARSSRPSIATHFESDIEPFAKALLAFDAAYQSQRSTSLPRIGEDDVVISWAEFDLLREELAARLARFGPHMSVVGVARGGLAPAAAIANDLQIRLFGTVRAWKYVDSTGPGPTQEVQLEDLVVPLSNDTDTVVVIDEIVDTAETMEAIGLAIRSQLPSEIALVQASLIRRTTAETPSDCWVAAEWARTITSSSWVWFPWEARRDR